MYTIVKFKVTEICDTRKSGSSVELNALLEGSFDGKNSVFYNDVNGQEWVFYVGDTCELV